MLQNYNSFQCITVIFYRIFVYYSSIKSARHAKIQTRFYLKANPLSSRRFLTFLKTIPLKNLLNKMLRKSYFNIAVTTAAAAAALGQLGDDVVD